MKKTELRTVLIVGGFALALAGGAVFTLREAFQRHSPKAAVAAEGAVVARASVKGKGAPAAGARGPARARSAAGAVAPGAEEAVAPIPEAPEFYPHDGQITDLASLDAAHLVMLEAHPEMKEQLEQLRMDIEADMQALAAAGGE